MKEDIRGHCNRDCIYSDNGRCDMWDDFAMPEDISKCNNYSPNFDTEDEEESSLTIQVMQPD